MFAILQRKSTSKRYLGSFEQFRIFGEIANHWMAHERVGVTLIRVTCTSRYHALKALWDFLAFALHCKLSEICIAYCLNKKLLMKVNTFVAFKKSCKLCIIVVKSNTGGACNIRFRCSYSIRQPYLWHIVNHRLTGQPTTTSWFRLQTIDFCLYQKSIFSTPTTPDCKEPMGFFHGGAS